MTETFEQRAIRNLNQRHLDGARRAALHIQETAGWILAELDKGQIPSHHLVADAVDLEQRIAALDAVRDATGIWESADTGQSPLPATHGGHPIDARENRP